MSDRHQTMKFLQFSPPLVSDKVIPREKRITTPGTYTIKVEIRILFWWVHHSVHDYRAHGRTQANKLEKLGLCVREVEIGKNTQYRWRRYQSNT